LESAVRTGRMVGQRRKRSGLPFNVEKKGGPICATKRKAQPSKVGGGKDKRKGRGRVSPLQGLGRGKKKIWKSAGGESPKGGREMRTGSQHPFRRRKRSDPTKRDIGRGVSSSKRGAISRRIWKITSKKNQKKKISLGAGKPHGLGRDAIARSRRSSRRGGGNEPGEPLLCKGRATLFRR